MTKRTVSFVLFIMFILCLCSCKDSKKEKKTGIDVEYYANLGQIPECEYSLGKKSSDIISAFKKMSEKSDENSEEEFFYNLNEQDEKTVISVSNCDYICDSKSKDEVTKIVCFGDSYGFKNGTVSIEVKKALSSYGFETEERAVTENEQNLFKVGKDCTVLEYKFKKATVIFAFQENLLLGAAIF